MLAKNEAHTLTHNHVNLNYSLRTHHLLNVFQLWCDYIFTNHKSFGDNSDTIMLGTHYHKPETQLSLC